ncbi:MAG: type II toxin-antitoxin system VapC family toxin [Verrucomicrobiota bacterium]
MKSKVYLETTIPSLLTARPSRDVLIAGQQQATRDWWEERRRLYKLFISGLVLAESRRGDSSAALARDEVLATCNVLEYTEAAQRLAEEILAARLLPAKAALDAAHIAIASVHEMDFLLTWNCRHIANAAIVDKVRATIAAAGYAPPVICTPLELMI